MTVHMCDRGHGAAARRAGAAILLAGTMLAGAAGAVRAQAIEDVVTVTGSRIPRPDANFSNPVAIVDAEALTNSGDVVLVDFLQDTPALSGSVGLDDNADNGPADLVGLTHLNLRNLGAQRTLVLVDGRRHVGASAGSVAVDVNTIPVALVERVDVLTGASSAIYGADGVSGVVNFIMKDDFEGLDVRVQAGGSEDGGAEQALFSAVAGQNFDAGRSNLTLAFEFARQNRIKPEQRSYYRPDTAQALVPNPADPGIFSPSLDDPDLFDLVLLGDLRFVDTSPGGSVFTDIFFNDSLSGVDFTGDGKPWSDGTSLGGAFAHGGDGTPVTRFEEEILPLVERYSGSARYRRDLTPEHRFFVEGKYVVADVNFRGQPTFDGASNPLLVPIFNPYIPPAILADALGPAGLGRFQGGVGVIRDNFDLGRVGRDIRRQTWRGVAGLEGSLSPHADYQVSYVYGRTEERSDFVNNRIRERWLAAIDSVELPSGAIVCRSDLDPSAVPPGANPATFGTTFTPGPNSGCIPADIFGEDVSPAAAAWINEDSRSHAVVEQHVVNAYLSGDIAPAFASAGPIGWAAGAEYREESSSSTPSDIEQLAFELGDDDLSWAGAQIPASGSFDVWEAFAEARLPLIADAPLIQELTLDAAFRLSDYSTAGTTETWKVGGLWRINDQIMLRATEAKAVRAPNLGELFAPRTQAFARLNDPCDNNLVGQGTAVRYENCLADLGADPNGFNSGIRSVEGVSGGNPDLEPETARTTTFGAVLSPAAIPGLTLAVDYFDIELSEAIQFFGVQTIVDKCYDLPRPNDFCSLVGRDPATGVLDSFDQRSVNVARYDVSGVDLTARYDLDPADWGVTQDVGLVSLSLAGSYLEDLTFVEVAGATPDQSAGDPGAPKWQAVFDATWSRGDWSVNYGLSWQERTRRYSEALKANNPDLVDPGYLYFDERWEHDIRVAYGVSDAVSLYAGINNLTDQHPQPNGYETPVQPIGRLFYAGLTARFSGAPFLN